MSGDLMRLVRTAVRRYDRCHEALGELADYMVSAVDEILDIRAKYFLEFGKVRLELPERNRYSRFYIEFRKQCPLKCMSEVFNEVLWECYRTNLPVFCSGGGVYLLPDEVKQVRAVLC